MIDVCLSNSFILVMGPCSCTSNRVNTSGSLTSLPIHFSLYLSVFSLFIIRIQVAEYVPESSFEFRRGQVSYYV